MCGIVGFCNLKGEPAQVGLLKRMTDTIAHRGPDGEGHHVDGPVGLGHRRLAIIDTSLAGKQPMANETGEVIITYNGMIYNFQKLRVELQLAGHCFRSQADTEVIVHAYEEWGENSVKRFNGMFAFVIWDKRNQELFLARDRYGIKPLYYAFVDGHFLFASENKAILEHPAVTRELDLEALLEYFTFQNFFTDRTLLRDIKIFPAGCWAKLPVDFTGQELSHQRYLDLRHGIENLRCPKAHLQREKLPRQLKRAENEDQEESEDDPDEDLAEEQ